MEHKRVENATQRRGEKYDGHSCGKDEKQGSMARHVPVKKKVMTTKEKGTAIDNVKNEAEG